MKLIFTKKEVAKIVLEYANRMCAEGVYFTESEINTYSQDYATVSVAEQPEFSVEPMKVTA